MRLPRTLLVLVGACVVACGSEATEIAPSTTPPPAEGGTEPTPDAAAPAPSSDAGTDAGSTASRCTLDANGVKCTNRRIDLPAIAIQRPVTYELPVGAPPAKGWPVVVYFQGSFVSAAGAFEGKKDDPFGIYHLALTVKELLDRGYAVLAPHASFDGNAFWQTNVPPWSELWTTSSDHAFMQSIFDAVAEGKLGKLDASRLYAMGVSSGGFMVSRMAVSYAGKFRALAVHSGGYATCSALCSVPKPLPTDHPPTLFLHGEQDNVVPLDVMKGYRDELAAEGRTVATVLDPKAGHEWIAAGPKAIADFFVAHP